VNLYYLTWKPEPKELTTNISGRFPYVTKNNQVIIHAFNIRKSMKKKTEVQTNLKAFCTINENKLL
jgi:hypothetical protein